jgi:hypothetical protein
MIPTEKYIETKFVPVVTLELVQKYHGEEGANSFLAYMLGQTVLELEAEVGYFFYDYERWCGKKSKKVMKVDTSNTKTIPATHIEKIPHWLNIIDPECPSALTAIVINSNFKNTAKGTLEVPDVRLVGNK